MAGEKKKRRQCEQKEQCIFILGSVFVGAFRQTDARKRKKKEKEGGGGGQEASALTATTEK